MAPNPFQWRKKPYYERLQDWERQIVDAYIAKFPELKDEMESKALSVLELYKLVSVNHGWAVEDAKRLISECKTAREFKRKFPMWRALLPRNTTRFY